MTISLPAPPDAENLHRAERFFGLYALQTLVGPSETPYYLGSLEPRCCRFCGKTAPQVTFKKEAHAIPDFMGNRNVFAYFECDACNILFAKYEDSFANFLGVSRTFHQIRGKGNKIPKFKDPKTGFEVERGANSIEMRVFDEHDPITIDHETKTIKLVTERPGHVPLHIVKLLIKIGLTLLDPEEVADYAWACKFITSEAADANFKDDKLLYIYGYSLPGPAIFRAPFAHLYTRKKGVTEDIVEKQLVLFFGNYFFQIILPFGQPDRRLHGKTITVPRYPLLIQQEWLDRFGPAQVLTWNFTSSEKKKASTHKLSFSFEGTVEYPVNQTPDAAALALNTTPPTID
jgi:hypothetical protein